MRNPLDDALDAHDDRQASRRRIADARKAKDAELRREFAALVEDFVARMNRAGNPGTIKEKLPRGKSRRLPARTARGWRLRTGSDDRRTHHLFVTVDGLVPPGFGASDSRWVPARRSALRLDRRELDELGRSMAELIRANGL